MKNKRETEKEKRNFHKRVKVFFEIMLSKKLNVETDIVKDGENNLYSVNISSQNALVYGKGNNIEMAIYDTIANLMNK